MIELKVWLEQYRKIVEEVFGTRIVCIGLQGSYGRGEANPESDLDMVLILDTLSMDDLGLSQGDRKFAGAGQNCGLFVVRRTAGLGQSRRTVPLSGHNADCWRS